ncbi:MAG: CCA tRNA nucleotidyltransferase, partial [Gemmataceae bacterium]
MARFEDPRSFALHIVQTLQQAGFIALFAGGCVRDELLGLVPKDYDVATSATPEEVQARFPRTLAVGASFGVIAVRDRKPGTNAGWWTVEVATFRTDGLYVDGRRPETVQFSSPQEDAQRRDFTINGLFQDPITGHIIDYVDGQIDLRNRVLRAIGDPVERFREDKLRILRAARMAARFALAIDAETLSAARGLASEVTVVSAERISEEFRKMLGHPARSLALRHLTALGLAPVLLPEVELEHWFAPQHEQLP